MDFVWLDQHNVSMIEPLLREHLAAVGVEPQHREALIQDVYNTVDGNSTFCWALFDGEVPVAYILFTLEEGGLGKAANIQHVHSSRRGARLAGRLFAVLERWCEEFNISKIRGCTIRDPQMMFKALGLGDTTGGRIVGTMIECDVPRHDQPGRR